MKINHQFPNISDIVYINLPGKKETMGIVISGQKRIPGIGYIFSILTSSGVKDILRENIHKKKNVSKL